MNFSICGNQTVCGTTLCITCDIEEAVMNADPPEDRGD